MSSERTVSIYDDTGRLLLSRVIVPECFPGRAKGLLGRTHIDKDEGMLLEPCRCIHMLGMRIPLDIVFLDSNGVALSCVEYVKPWRLAACLRASKTLETAAGNIKRLRIHPGLRLVINP